jgi:hypothetical protein
MLYHLNHASSPVPSGYSGDGVLLFAWASLDLDPPDLGHLHSLGWQAKLFIEMESLEVFTMVGLEPTQSQHPR